MKLKTKLVNVLLLNIFTCSTLCITAQLLTILQGNLDHFIPAMFGMNFGIAYPIACIVGLFVPAVNFAQAVCVKLTIDRGPLYGIVFTLSINVIYTLVLSTVMTWFNVMYLNGQSFAVAAAGWLWNFVPMWLLSSLISWVVSGPIGRIAFKLTGEAEP